MRASFLVVGVYTDNINAAQADRLVKELKHKYRNIRFLADVIAINVTVRYKCCVLVFFFFPPTDHSIGRMAMY